MTFVLAVDIYIYSTYKNNILMLLYIYIRDVFSRMRSEGFPFIVGGLGVGPLFAASWSARRFRVVFRVVNSVSIARGSCKTSCFLLRGRRRVYRGSCKTSCLFATWTSPCL